MLVCPYTRRSLGGGLPRGNVRNCCNTHGVEMKAVLFLCTGNSCRSQMAEGFARALRGSEFRSYSAGIKKHGLNRIAVQVMNDVGIDISHHQSKTLDALKHIEFDYVVTVCDDAQESCPAFSGAAKVIHRSFDDPPRLAARAASDEEAIDVYRRVRDEIRAFIETLPEAFESI